MHIHQEKLCLISAVSFEDQVSFDSFPKENGQVFVGAYQNFLTSGRSTVFA